MEMQEHEYSYKKQLNVENVKARLNDCDASERLKLSADGLEVTTVCHLLMQEYTQLFVSYFKNIQLNTYRRLVNGYVIIV